MNAEIGSTFSEFITDKDGEYSKAQFISLADKLLREGRRPDRVFRAMLYAGWWSSLQHSIEEHYAFVRIAVEDSAQWEAELEPVLDEMIDEEK